MEVNICFGTTSAAGDGAKKWIIFSNETPFFSLFFLHTENLFRGQFQYGKAMLLTCIIHAASHLIYAYIMWLLTIFYVISHLALSQPSKNLAAFFFATFLCNSPRPGSCGSYLCPFPPSFLLFVLLFAIALVHVAIFSVVFCIHGVSSSFASSSCVVLPSQIFTAWSTGSLRCSNPQSIAYVRWDTSCSPTKPNIWFGNIVITRINPSELPVKTISSLTFTIAFHRVYGNLSFASIQSRNSKCSSSTLRSGDNFCPISPRNTTTTRPPCYRSAQAPSCANRDMLTLHHRGYHQRFAACRLVVHLRNKIYKYFVFFKRMHASLFSYVPNFHHAFVASRRYNIRIVQNRQSLSLAREPRNSPNRLLSIRINQHQ